jgi:hypothetical protein
LQAVLHISYADMHRKLAYSLCMVFAR